MGLRKIVLLFVLMTSTLTASISTIGIEVDTSIGVDAETKPERKTLVVYFSRTGNTELLAQEIAGYYQASLLALEAKEYPVGLRGLLHAVADSQEKQALISPEKIELSAYDTVFIGAPIWRYSPAPPVWQFIDNNKLANKKVVLFSTFNSGFQQKYIDEFQARVEAQGGVFISHLYIRRGRMLVQIGSEALLARAREELEKLEL